MVKEWPKWATLGALAGLVTVPLLKGISTIASAIPGVDVNLQSVQVSTSGLGEVVNPGMGIYLQKLIDVLPLDITATEWLMTAVGGALFVLFGAWIVMDVLKYRSPNKILKLGSVFFFGGLATSAVLAMSLTIPAWDALVIGVLNALLLAAILSVVIALLPRKAQSMLP